MKRIVLLLCICCGIILPLFCQGQSRTREYVRKKIGIPAYVVKYDELYNFYVDLSTSTTAARKIKLETLKGQIIDWVGIVYDSVQASDGSYWLQVDLGGEKLDMLAELAAAGVTGSDEQYFFSELLILVPVTRDDVLKYKKGDYIHMNRQVADFEMPRDYPIQLGPSITLAR